MSRIKNDFTHEEQLHLRALGKRLELFREGLGIKPAELCKMAQIDRDGYVKIEKGIRNPSMAILFQISENIGISIERLFDNHYIELYKEIEKEEMVDRTVNENFCRLLKRKKVISMIKKYRKKKHMSQAIFSIKTGIPRDVINNFEYGRAKITPVLMKAIISVMELTPEEVANLLQ